MNDAARFSFWLTRTDRQALSQLARQEHVSAAAALRRAIYAGLENGRAATATNVRHLPPDVEASKKSDQN